jgi:D-amino peptidase
MKVHITADMEGVATVSHDYQVDNKNAEFPRSRQLMTDEVKAAIAGAKDGGADRILVCDAHDTGRNIYVEQLDDDVEVIQGSAYELGMMAGISKDFDASFQVGYHSMRHTHAGTLGHTYTYTISELKFNGVTVGESGLSAAIAGHFGVPLVFVSGDAHAVKQAQKLVKNIVGAPTKTGVGLYGTHSLNPKMACEKIRKGAKDAMDKVDRIRPFVVKRPVLMQVQFERPLMAQYASKIPMTKRVDIRTVSFKAKDVVEAFDVFCVMNQVACYAKDEGPL